MSSAAPLTRECSRARCPDQGRKAFIIGIPSARAATTKGHGLGALNSRNIFPTVLEAGSPRSGPSGRCQGPLPSRRQLPAFSLSSHDRRMNALKELTKVKGPLHFL